MPAEAKATFDGIIVRVNEVAFGCDLAGKGKTAGKQERAADKDIAIGLFHHIFPGNDHHALDQAGEGACENRGPALPANPGILTGRAPLLEKDPAGQCAISLACFWYQGVV